MYDDGSIFLRAFLLNSYHLDAMTFFISLDLTPELQVVVFICLKVNMEVKRHPGVRSDILREREVMNCDDTLICSRLAGA
jgi:hypothetical protein